MNESVRRTPRPSSASRPNPAIRPFLKKRQIEAAVEKSREAKPLRPRKPFFRQKYKPEQKQEKETYTDLSEFPCGIKTLLKQWVKDAVAILPHVDQLPSEEDSEDAKHCPFQREK